MTTPNLEYWGKHLIVNAKAVSNDDFENRGHCQQFIDELVEVIGMVKYGDLHFVSFANHDPDKGGPSFYQMIETSNISGHMVNNRSEIFLDIFSCKDFEASDALEVIQKYYPLLTYETRVLYRVAP